MKLPEPYASDFRKHLEIFEGRVSWMYLDQSGNVTCAIGHMIPSAEAAGGSIALLFIGGDPAADWKSVKAAWPGANAIGYEHLSTCRLTDEAIEAICDADEEDISNQLIQRIPAYVNYPPPVQQAILDMAFNLGVGKLASEFFGQACHFGPALDRGDYATAAAESTRRGIQQSRNDYTAALIRSAIVTRIS
jgi:GH24 family phage-related lysozyme (muramidase)